jgi:hypothetical protein
MKHVGIVLFLGVLGYGMVVGWQELLTTMLQNGGCEVYVSNVDTIQLERLLGAALMLLCYPFSYKYMHQVSALGLYVMTPKVQALFLVAFVVGANLCALLRTTIIAKHNLSDAFAEQVVPSLDLVVFDVTTWMFYGVLSALVMSSIVLVPIAVIGREED